MAESFTWVRVKHRLWLALPMGVIVATLLTGCVVPPAQPAAEAPSTPVTSDTDLTGGTATNLGGAVIGRVIDPAGNPVDEATVSVSKGTAAVPEITAITVLDGSYRWDLPAGTFTLEVHKDGFAPASFEVTVADGETITHDVTLQPE